MNLKSITIVIFVLILSEIVSGICTAAPNETISNAESPLILDGQVQQFQAPPTAVSSDIKLEHTLWSKTLDGYPLIAPIAYKDITFINTSSSLLAIETSTGNLKWEHTTPDDSVQISTPVIVGTYICYTKVDTLYVLEADSGQLAWFKKLQKDSENLDLHSMGTYDNLLIFTDHNELKAINVETQEEVWVNHQSMFSYSEPTLHIVGENIFVAIPGSIYIYNAANGETIKSWETGNIHSSLHIWGDKVIAVGTFGEVEACDIETGELLWKFITNENVGVARSGIAFSEDTLYITNHKDGFLYAISPENGNLQWSKQIGTPTFARRIFYVNSKPTYHNQVIYIGRWVEEDSSSSSNFKPLKGEMLALDSTSGDILKKYPIPKSFAQAPLIINGKFLVLPASGSSGDVVMIE
ncbi:PQQ-binding-like beta-propeller repeat protein [Paenibacillus sp. LMG 31456]|uniref:PQQ-binding-like beta-propeller repeat protein n=1 Tax=Paenibacillus foliorum TaxID=2654974 RepID=A0A972GS11_9BACL|nr:PQQ-binding-like beta-propeller repeat protein [Paenibacillus foliorum]NOU92777.1 PQQ-binding-like beta-propeller repeat protein [Paenibacillus foliorum]